MNNHAQFTPDLVIHAFIQAVRVHELAFNSETDAFQEFFNTYSGWIVQNEPMQVYVGDGEWVDYDTWKKNQGSASTYCGGHFTLREHHMPKTDES